MGSDRVKCGETAGASNTLRSLTHSLDCGKEGLAVHATHETWRPVVGHEGSYEVSDQGNVRSLDRTTIRNGHVHKLRGKVLVPVRASEYGYLRVSLGRGKPQFVHRLVAAAFIGPGDGFDVDHRDGNPTNNRLSNLRYLTHAENMVAQRERKPRCRQGHEYSEDRLDSRGRRACMECTRIRDRARYRRAAEAQGKTVTNFRITHAFLEQVAEVFASTNRGRRAAIMSRFGVSEAQAKRYIRAARKEGLL